MARVRTGGAVVAGLALMAWLGAFAAEPPVIEVVLGSYYIKPDRITVKVGEPVTLKVTNEARVIPHNLVIQAPEAGIDIKVEVRGGQASSVTFLPLRAGTYEMWCSKKMPLLMSHKERGMTGTLEVVE